MNELPYPSIITSRRVVPNAFPLIDPGESRLAIIGEAPGEKEENYGQPFYGPSGDLLSSCLRDLALDRTRIFIGNICQVRPPNNEITRFAWDGNEIQEGLGQLSSDLLKFDPNVCVLLGNTPLRAAGIHGKISSWSGSLFRSSVSPFLSRKCIASFHPAGILREFGSEGNFFRLKHTLARAKDECRSPELHLPVRSLRTDYSAEQICQILDTWPTGERCSLDIEGGLPRDAVNLRRLKPKKGQRPFGWPCVSLASSPSTSFTIAWSRFREESHAAILSSFARLMYRTDVPKVLQNQLYDNFVLSFGYGIPIRHVSEDVMIKSWCIFAELPRALGCQASVWTREPHWKDDSMYGSDGEGLYRGCALDSAVTLEICEAQDSALAGSRLEHYHKMRSIQSPFLYMQVRGIKYDQEKVSSKLAEVQAQMLPVRERLAAMAGRDLCGESSLSSKKLQEALYLENRGYEPQYKKENGRLTTKLTTDIEAILNLKKKNQQDPFLADIALHRHLEGLRETLQIEADPDGRVRCGYSLEAETGRVKCYTSPTGSGANLQTIQSSLRGNYVSDPSYDFAQCDLEGADGWTVAAHCARLGDRRMLEDYLAGMKPAKLIALMYWFGNELNKLDMKSTKFAHDNLFPIVKREVGSWIYLGAKRVQHGTSYLMGIPTMQLNVLKDSFKESGVPVYIEHRDARTLQEDCMLQRYPGVPLWHTWAESILRSKGTLESASGHVRVFFGRRYGKDVKDTVKEFLAHEPQNNTTWATNLAMLKLWKDPENRVTWVDKKKFLFSTGDFVQRYWSGDLASWNRIWPGSLIIEPLHQVHDALCVQWPTFIRSWARAKMRTYFQNPLTIAGTTLTIPFDGGYGDSWGTAKTPI